MQKTSFKARINASEARVRGLKNEKKRLKIHYRMEIKSIRRDHTEELKRTQCVSEEQIALTRRAEREHQRGYL